MGSMLLSAISLSDMAQDQRLSALILVWIILSLAVAVLAWPQGRGRRRARQIFALAILAFREGLRQNVLWTVFGLALIPGFLAYFSDSDGTHAGRARLILDTCLSCGEVLGAALVVLLSALSAPREIETRVMYTLGVKPVPRWSILAGKALGFWTINLLFLLGLISFTAMLVCLVPMRQETRKASATGSWQELRRTALVVRDFKSEDGASESNVIRPAKIKPGESATWNFTVDPQQSLHAVRMLLSSSMAFGSGISGVKISVAYPNQPPIYESVMQAPPDRPFEILLNDRDISKAGILQVTVAATQSGPLAPAIFMQRATGVRLGAMVSDFESNLFKAFVLMALQGGVIALIVTGWSGVLSFPVAVALGIFFLLGGEMSRYALEILQSGADQTQGLGSGAGSGDLQHDSTLYLRWLLTLLPDFQATGGPTSFIEGHFVPGVALASAALWTCVVRGLGWALAGVLFFHRRELGN